MAMIILICVSLFISCSIDIWVIPQYLTMPNNCAYRILILGEFSVLKLLFTDFWVALSMCQVKRELIQPRLWTSYWWAWMYQSFRIQCSHRKGVAYVLFAILEPHFRLNGRSMLRHDQEQDTEVLSGNSKSNPLIVRVTIPLGVFY